MKNFTQQFIVFEDNFASRNTFITSVNDRATAAGRSLRKIHSVTESSNYLTSTWEEASSSVKRQQNTHDTLQEVGEEMMLNKKIFSQVNDSAR